MTLSDDTPVLVDWYVHKHIPSKHYVMVTTYAMARTMVKQGAKITCHTIDTDLYSELFQERR